MMKNHSSPMAAVLPVLALTILLPYIVGAASADATIALCPVIQYSSDVQELSMQQLNQLQLTALESQSLSAVAAGSKKAYAIVLQPLSYTHNTSFPKVDWVDLHYRIGSAGVLENVQMKAHTSVAPIVSMPPVASQPQMDANMMASMNSAQSSMNIQGLHHPTEFVFSPIFLTPSDQLLYTHTICSNSIDCESAMHTFTPSQIMQQHDQQQPIMHTSQQVTDQSNLKLAQAPQRTSIESGSPGVCPAVNYTSRVHCTESSCKLSFINLSPNRTVDWVDVHVVSNSSSFAHAAGQSSLSVWQMVRENFRMAHVGGAVSTMSTHIPHMSTSVDMAQSALIAAHLTSLSSLSAFGAESAPQSLMNATGGSQVFQFMVPLGFRNGDMIGISYTYCAQGTDCDTEVQMYRLRDEEKQMLISDQKLSSAGAESISHQLLQQSLPMQVPTGYAIRITERHSSTALLPGVNGAAAAKQESQSRGQVEQTQLQHVQL